MITLWLRNVIKRVPSTNISEFPLQRDGGGFTQASVCVICDNRVNQTANCIIHLYICFLEKENSSVLGRLSQQYLKP